ncbi:carbohydrate porin [Prochlorococcus marinus XMU1410]|uniref:carbohydrate porin n=1 Tax=Prochlorococcus marinus TaxID=1219 RepID=UPI001AD95F13|nr:carbohydrate porin [Prochlorococcus marinus]MBO8242304.1 carbohydrate porin [Prochlorococcus marinus XMU1410]MBW3053452.1 porin [Prochlorococcus marinus str. MU1410]
MKLFQQMLVAGASLSLLTPIVAQASDVNLEEMNSYSRSNKSSKTLLDSKTFSKEIVNLNERVDNIESKFNEFEAGGFSDTTVLDGKAIFDVGSVDTDDDTYDGTTQFMYTYTLNLNTSFSGDDNLYTRIKTGNHTSWSKTKSVYNTYLSSGNGNGDTLKVDKLWYTTPVGDSNHTVTFGPKIENYYMHATTPSIYEPVLKAFTLGGNAAAYGASTSPGVGWAYTADNGFAMSSNITSKNPIFTNEAKQSWATQVGYTQPNYSVSALVNMKYNGWTDSYFMTTDGKARPGDKNSTNVGLRAWWRPTDAETAIPSISVGYDTSETDASSNSNTTAYFVGLNWTDVFNADDKIGLAFGQPQMVEGETIEPFLYELYYKYKVNDSISVTPTIFGGTSKNSSDVETDMTGYLLQTTFKF